MPREFELPGTEALMRKEGDRLILLVAAHAVVLGNVLVTDNEREFSRIGDLVCENWLKEPG